MRKQAETATKTAAEASFPLDVRMKEKKITSHHFRLTSNHLNPKESFIHFNRSEHCCLHST